MSSPKIMTASRFKLFAMCQRKHYYRFDQMMEEEKRSLPLVFGTAVHAGLEHWWISRTEENPKGDDESALKAYGKSVQEEGLVAAYGEDPAMMGFVMLKNYFARWRDDGLIGVLVEHKFLYNMPDPYFGGDGTWKISGKIDAIVKDTGSGKYYLLDHKTATGGIEDDSMYWKKLDYDPQISMYTIAAGIMGYKIEGFIYDVLKRPHVKRALATPKEKRKYKKNGEPYANTREEDECIESLELRLQEDYDNYMFANFKRKTILRPPSELEQFNMEMFRAAEHIDSTKDKHDAFRNLSSCTAYNRPCPYVEACRGGDIKSLQGVKESIPFPELEEFNSAGDGKGV